VPPDDVFIAAPISILPMFVALTVLTLVTVRVVPVMEPVNTQFENTFENTIFVIGVGTVSV
jgi:hypothetical protein